MQDSMTSGWDFHNPVRIHAGPATLAMLPALVEAPGALLFVTSAGTGRREVGARVSALLSGREVHRVEDVAPNPDLRFVEEQLARLDRADFAHVVAIGGGSVLDTAKILAIGVSAEAFSLRGHILGGEPLPARRRAQLICVPTTAGTGSEVTPFATVWDHATKRKYSVAGPSMFPDVALLDPELTLTLPEEVTLSTGLDAITQGFEATWSRHANPVSTAFAIRAIRAGLDSLSLLRTRPDDLGLRGTMLEASLLAGLAISRTRTALCHSMSYPITARFGLPHGFACGFTLPEVFAFNQQADPERFNRLANDLGFGSAGDLHARLLTLMDELRIGEWLQGYVGDGRNLAELAPEMLTPGRADNNLRAATVAEVAAIMDDAVRGRGLHS